MEENLVLWSSRQYKEAIEKQAEDVSHPLHAKAKKIDDFIHGLISESQKQLHDVFTKTYGVLYERNAFVFREYFRELNSYYHKGNINLQNATMTFFTSLYQKMFTVMNSQYTFDDAYLTCVVTHMGEQKPFGEVPTKVASAVKRSMVATRAMVKALKSGYQIAEQMKRVPASDRCLKAVQKMNTCPTCQGLPELKPCNDYCLNVMRGCLASHIEMQKQWDLFVESLTGLADRLTGPFNVETVILPLDINISDAIMNFQGSGFQVTQKVFESCGTPRIVMKRDVAAVRSNSELAGQLQAAPRRVRAKGKSGKSDFEKLVVDLKKVIRNSFGFWRDLPQKMCQTTSASSSKIPRAPSSSNNQCWNGTAAAPYTRHLAPEGLQSHNPEVQHLISEGNPENQIARLQSITKQLKLALQGSDVEWWDKEMDTEHAVLNDMMMGEGGSGDGDGEWTDVDDDGSSGYGFGHDDSEEGEEEGGSGEYEGSGGGDPNCDDEDGCKGKWPGTAWNPWNATTSTTTTTTTTTTAIPDITILEEDPKEKNPPRSSGSSSLVVAKAVFIFLLPQFVSWLPQVFGL